VAISVVAQVPGLTAEEDAALVQALNLEGSPPAGGKTRLDGPAAGGRRIVGLWDSDTDYERFRNDRLMPAVRGLGRAAGDRETARHRNGPHSPCDLTLRHASHRPSAWPSSHKCRCSIKRHLKPNRQGSVGLRHRVMRSVLSRLMLDTGASFDA
jgi:hypothetical protein